MQTPTAPPMAPPPPGGAIEWVENRTAKTWRLRYLFYGAIAFLNFLIIGFSIGAGRTPSIIEVVFGVVFLWFATTAKREGRQIPLRTGLSADAVHIERRSGPQAFPIASIQRVATRFSWGSALKMEIFLTQGGSILVPGIHGTRIREVQRYVERRKVDLEAQATVVAGTAGPPLAPGVIPPAPPTDPDAGTSDWNASQLPDGGLRPDYILTSRNVGVDGIPRGDWISTGRKFAKGQQKYAVLLVAIAVPLMIVAFGQNLDIPYEVLLPVAIGSALFMAVAVGMATQKDVKGEVGRSIMRLPPTVPTPADAQSLVVECLRASGTEPPAARTVKGKSEWTVGKATKISVSGGTRGGESFLAVISKSREDLALHRAFKGHVLRALVPSGPPAPPPPPAGGEGSA